jgi:hypothetical protein
MLSLNHQSGVVTMPKPNRKPAADAQPLPQTAEQSATVTVPEQSTSNLENTEQNATTTTAPKPTHRVWGEHYELGIRYLEDHQRHCVAIQFDNKPSEDVIAKLRASPFKWNGEVKAWLAPSNFVNRGLAQKLFREFTTQEQEQGQDNTIPF